MSTLPDGWPEHTLGWGVLKWCSKYLRQPDGEHAGDPWLFTTTQARFIAWWYAVNEFGKFPYHRGILRWSKGAGKSPMVAAMALAELCGPVRFDRWENGEPVGVPVALPWVQIAATAESQTDNTMSMVTAMAPRGSRVVREYGLDVGKEKIHKPGGGRLLIITSSAAAAEGARSTFCIADETEWWLASNGGHALDAVIRRNAMKLGGRMLETCNAYVPGQDSVAEKSHRSWQQQQEGRTRLGGILYDAREAPADTDPKDEASLRAGLAVAYADADWIDLDRVVAEYYDPSTGPDVARRFFLNQIVAAEDAWVAPHDWAVLADATKVVADTDPIVMFFDGSRSRDATALIGCRVSDGHVFTLGVWEPKNRDDEVPVQEIDGRIAQVFDRYDVKAFYADVKEWESFAKVSWPEMYQDRLIIWAKPNGQNTHSIAWDMRGKAVEFIQACETVYSEIMERKFTHDGDATLARHVGNARRQAHQYGTYIGPETKDSPRKMDAATAMVGSRIVRQHLLASKAWQKYIHRSTGRGRVIVLE